MTYSGKFPLNYSQLLNSRTAGLLWKHFQEICLIPHPSGHEEALCRYIVDFAEQKGLSWKTDNTGNLYVYKPATQAGQSRPAVLLQSHLDMVAEKVDSLEHDFLTDPLSLQVNGDWLSAKGTTLGADNGIGVAATLALLEDDQTNHGPLEALFTVKEETGMVGAQGIDPTLFSAEFLINMDSEEDGILYIGCACGVNVIASYDCSMEQVSEELSWYKLELSGLFGGHSGADIHIQRGNSIQLMVRLLKQLEPYGLRLHDFKSGTVSNAIPRQAVATIGIPKANIKEFAKSVDDNLHIFQKELGSVEQKLVISYEKTDEKHHAFPVDEQSKWLNALQNCHSGVKRYSDHFDGVVETSNNLGVISMEDGSVQVDCLVRSLIDTRTIELADNICGLFEIIGADVKQVDFVNGWQPNPDSLLLDIMSKEYLCLSGEMPKIEVIHAGLECGIVAATSPGMDIVSFGPEIEHAHTPEERVSIASVDKFLNLLKATLERIAV